MNSKPLRQKAYGSIPHLSESHVGVGDKRLKPPQSQLLTNKCKPGDKIIVTEKLDGSCVAILKHEGRILPLNRAGYLATDSPHEQHLKFAEWVMREASRWSKLLYEGERIVGEWIMLPHGTKYDLDTAHELFYAFDLMKEHRRYPRDKFIARLGPNVQTTPLIHEGGPISVQDAMSKLGPLGLTGIAQEPVEGAVWRLERGGEVQVLGKYARPGFVPGKYLDEGVD